MKIIDLQLDPWRPFAAEPGPAGAHALLDLARWLALRDQWPAGLPVGVALQNTDDVAALAADAGRLVLVSLEFPKWTDGRAYSQARLLRSRLRFAGELRATGHVLVDMLPLLQRSGFDTAVLRADQNPATAARVLAGFPGHYQADPLTSASPFARHAA